MSGRFSGGGGGGGGGGGAPTKRNQLAKFARESNPAPSIPTKNSAHDKTGQQRPHMVVSYCSF